MKKFFLLPIFASVLIFANQAPFSTDNPYENISTIEDKQIKGENFVEVYENQNNVDHSSFTLFGFLESENEEIINSTCVIDPLTNECYPTDVPLPAPINHYQFLLIFIGLILVMKFRKNLKCV